LTDLSNCLKLGITPPRDLMKRAPRVENAVILFARVSTNEQGKSGLGIEAQIDSMTRYSEAHGLEILGTYTEVVSGKFSMASATFLDVIEKARKTGARILVSKIDRLTRSVADGATYLANSALPQVIATDCPNASSFELHIRLVLAEEERRLIGERTAAALRAKKARGESVGNEVGTAAHSAKVQKLTGDAIDRAKELRSQGLTLDATAAALNSEGYTSSRGGKWSRQSLHVRGL
jgi:DNA invertase Pin-like site-specific DNA recombinase